MRITAALIAILTSGSCAMADTADATRYSREDRAALNALIARTCARVDTVRAVRIPQNDIVQQVLDAAAISYLARKNIAK
jgi:hypothetical protein